VWVASWDEPTVRKDSQRVGRKVAEMAAIHEEWKWATRLERRKETHTTAASMAAHWVACWDGERAWPTVAATVDVWAGWWATTPLAVGRAADWAAARADWMATTTWAALWAATTVGYWDSC